MTLKPHRRIRELAAFRKTGDVLPLLGGEGRGEGERSRNLIARARSLAAFTMIEIALALAVIGFALVAIIGVLPAGMSVQRDNRESTLINFDANYLIDAITSGATTSGGIISAAVGLDDLTNHVIAITNYLTLCKDTGVPIPGETVVVAYTTTGTFTNGNPAGPSYLTNGANIIAVLTTAKYIPSANPPGSYYSNFTTADFRAITGSLADQGRSQSAQQFAFAYRIFPEVVPFGAAPTFWRSNPNGDNVATNFQNNFTQIRLRFRWPIFPTGQVGNSRLTFRTATSGYLQSQPVLGVPPPELQPGNYVGQ